MTTLPRWDRVQGDVDDIIVMDLDGVANLDGATLVEGHVWRTTHPVSSHVLTAAVLDSAAATVTVQLSPWLETAAAGVWKVDVSVTWATGEIRTWPAAGEGRLTVRADSGGGIVPDGDGDIILDGGTI